MDIVLTALIILMYGVVILADVDTSTNATKRFMSIDYTNTMKGLCCIIVVFVHILPAYQNQLQDAVGSFAYIGVTLFMLFSGYGIAFGVRHKDDYFDKFISKRLLVIFLPFALSIGLKTLCGFSPLSGGTGYIWLILFFYVSTYIAHKITGKRAGIWQYIACGIIISYSILGEIGITLGWSVEALGFAYGIVLEGSLEKIKLFFSEKKILSITMFTVLSCVVGVLYLKFKVIPVYGDYILKALLGVLLVLWVFSLTVNFSPKNRISTWLGSHSYEIYLYHGFIMSILAQADKAFEIKMASGIFIALTFGLTFLIAVPMHWVNAKIVSKLRK